MTEITSRAVATLCAALLANLFSGIAHGAALNPEYAAYERLEQTIDSLYEQTRAEAGTDASHSRGDVAGAVSDCRFLGQFQYLELLDYARIEEDRERCGERVAERYPNHPEVVLYGLEQLSGQALIGEAEAVLERGQAVGWTNRQAAHLYELLANAYAEQDPDKAGYYANAAMNLDLFSSVRELAVRWLIDRGQDAIARKMLTAPRLEEGQLAREIGLLFEIGADDLALVRYGELQGNDSQYYSKLDLARTLLRFDQPELAKEQYAAAIDGRRANDYTASVQYERLRVALERGDREDAIATYDALRTASWDNDSVLRLRLMLARAFPDVPWTWRELPGALMILAVLAASLALPLITLIAPVHYRGLVRQHAAKPGQPAPFAWRLEHAWMAISLALVLNLAAAYFLEPSFWSPGLPDGDSPVRDATDEVAIAHLTVASLGANTLAALLLLPFCGGLTGLQRLLSSTWDWRRTLSVVLLSWLSLRLLAAILIAAFGASGGGAAVLGIIAQMAELQTEIFATIQNIGLLPSVVLMGVIAPISEELLFRGVLLSAFARHLSFTFANGLQALLFAVIHGEVVLAPFFFAMGMIAGWTVKRSGGLRAAILLHMVNNLVAVVLRVAFSSLGGDS